MPLSADRQILFDQARKSMAVGYLLWGTLGLIGMHRFYVRRTLAGAAQLLLLLAGGSSLRIAFSQLVHIGQSTAHIPTGAESLETRQAATDATLAAVQSPMFYLGLALLAVAVVWWLIDLYFVQAWIRQHNNDLRLRLSQP